MSTEEITPSEEDRKTALTLEFFESLEERQ